MRSRLTTFTKAVAFLFLIILCNSCSKKDQPPANNTENTGNNGNTGTSGNNETKASSIDGNINGKDIIISAAAISPIYYTTSGDDVKALSTTLTLPGAGERVVVFINDFKDGVINIDKKLGTSLNPGTPGLKVNATTSPAVQSYVQYLVNGNAFYAYTGTIQITINGKTATIKWSVTFKDAAGKDFMSISSMYLSDFTSLVKAKTDIFDPTPVAVSPTIESISPTEGVAGDNITITGVNFSTTLTDNIVKIKDINADVVSATATKLIVRAPNSSTGALTVKVKNSTVITGPMFTFLQPVSVDSFAPAFIRVGDTVTITGRNFSTITSSNVVDFDNIKATVLSASATKLTVIAPQGIVNTGTIQVKVGGHFSAISKTSYTVNTSVWQEVPFSGYINARSLFITRDSIMLIFSGGFYRMVGNKVTDISNNLNQNDILALETNATTFFVCTNKGLYKSDNGISWTKLNVPVVQNEDFSSLIVSGDNITVMKGSTKYASADAGATWTKVSYGLSESYLFYNYLFADNNYYYSLDVAQGSGGKVIYKSADKGKTWVQTKGTVGPTHMSTQSPDFLKVSGNNFFIVSNPYGIEGTVQYLYKSSDQCDNWTKIGNEKVNTVDVSGNYVMYGGDSFNASSNNGNTFKNYIVPLGYVVHCVEKAWGYYYIICSNTLQTDFKLLKTPITN